MLKEELLPDGAHLQDSYDEAKKIIKELSLSYNKIDVCTNYCILYVKEVSKSDSCKFYRTSRWKIGTHSEETMHKKVIKVASKSLRYCPLKPRLQRLFMYTKTSTHMIWHNDKRVDNGIMRHPADSMKWKSLDELHPSFAAEPRNIRLGLDNDGFSHSKIQKHHMAF